MPRWRCSAPARTAESSAGCTLDFCRTVFWVSIEIPTSASSTGIRNADSIAKLPRSAWPKPDVRRFACMVMTGLLTPYENRLLFDEAHFVDGPPDLLEHVDQFGRIVREVCILVAGGAADQRVLERGVRDFETHRVDRDARSFHRRAVLHT